MTKDTLRQIANVLSVIVALTVNILAVALPLNGQNTGAISDRFKVYFVPAGYVFSIWGIIYIGWIAFLVFQSLPSQTQSPRLRKLGLLFALSCVFNAAWLFCWHYNQFGLSVIMMLMLLGLLIASYLRLNIGRTLVSNAEKWCVDIPFSLYLGWISVATIANVTDLLYFIKWDGFGIAAQVWAIIMLCVATLLGLLMAFSRKDSAYLFVFAWAFAGIAIKQAAETSVENSAWVAALVALGLAVYCMDLRGRVKGIPASIGGTGKS